MTFAFSTFFVNFAMIKHRKAACARPLGIPKGDACYRRDARNENSFSLLSLNRSFVVELNYKILR